MTADFDYDWFVSQFYKATHIDLQQYKRTQMERRLTSLRSKRGFSDFSSYLDACLRNADLMAELLDRMTINVSEFFRNGPRWETFTREVLPKLTQQATIRAWSAACSTGQEAYTLALLLTEQVPLGKFTIAATDIDENALRVARRGIYKITELEAVPGKLRNGFFHSVTTEAGVAEVKSELRARIQFTKHNLLSDTYEQNYDLIVCRNVLIYFTDEAKAQIYHKFAKSLRVGGFLFVGSTEQIFRPENYGFRQYQPFFYERVQ